LKNKGLSDLTTVESAIYALENASLLSGATSKQFASLISFDKNAKLSINLSFGKNLFSMGKQNLCPSRIGAP